MSEVLLEIKNVAKRFGATQALSDINLTVNKGSVHSLLGRNGAGKSTLVNIIAGLYSQDNGKVIFAGEEISGLSIKDRQKKGISLVTQHASVIPELSVGENIFLGDWPKTSKNLIDWEMLNSRAYEELKNYGLDINPRIKVKDLDIVDQRKVNIVRALNGGAKLIILDEPTTALSTQERDNLFDFIKKLSNKGTAFIFITHYLDEVIKISDEVTVLRDGLAFSDYDKKNVTEETLANLIAGEDVVLTQRDKKCEFPEDDIILECNSVKGHNINDVSFKLYKGEILGIVGFPGSGAREICRTLFGLLKQEDGEIKLNGKKVSFKSPEHSLKEGIVYIPNDRHTEGIVPMMTIRGNISLPILKTFLKGKWGMLNNTKEREIAKQYFNLLKVKANSIEDSLDSLSGGNQQKVVVSKVLSSKPKVLILDEPTVGIDIKSREEILSIVNKMSEEEGLSAIYLTNDFDELLRITDRLIFFRDGEIIGEVENKELQAEDVISLRDGNDACVV